MKIFFLITFLVSFSTFAEVTISDGTQFIGVSNGATESAVPNTLIYDVPSEDAGKESYPPTAYIPVGYITDAENQITFSTTANLPLASALSNAYFSTRIAVNNTEDDTFNMVGAVKHTDSTYKVFHNAIRLYDKRSHNEMIFLNLEEIILTSGATISLVAPSEITLKIMLFMADSPLPSPNEVVSVTDKGYFYNLKISSYLPAGQPYLRDLIKGDGRLKAPFDEGNNPVTNISADEQYQTLILLRSGVVESPGGDFYRNVSLVNGTIYDRLDYQSNGEPYVKNLTNGASYNISVALLSKYQFASPLSNSYIETPESIEAFLKKQSCYLFSAGFGEEHYVLDTLREFRDEFLQEFSLGRSFVSWYYKTAPKYAMVIYKSRILSFIIRSIGHVMHIFISYFGVIIGFSVLGFGAICLKNVKYS